MLTCTCNLKYAFVNEPAVPAFVWQIVGLALLLPYYGN